MFDLEPAEISAMLNYTDIQSYHAPHWALQAFNQPLHKLYVASVVFKTKKA